jgi:hypothetical protein
MSEREENGYVEEAEKHQAGTINLFVVKVKHH